MTQPFCDNVKALDSSRSFHMAMVCRIVFGAGVVASMLVAAFLDVARADAAADDGINVWWSEAIAAPSDDALDQSLYADFPIALLQRGTGKVARAADCFDVADLMERGYRPGHEASIEDQRRAYLCLARRMVAGAGIASQSFFRGDDGSVPSLSAADMMGLPAMVGPGEGCDLRAVKQLTANDWISVARYFHIYVAGHRHDYQEQVSIVDDRAAYAPGKLLVEAADHNRLVLTSTEMTVTLERLGLADINGDGVEDMILLRSPAKGLPRLVVLTKPRAESLISVLNRTDLFIGFTYSCPAQAVTLVTRKAEEGVCGVSAGRLGRHGAAVYLPGGEEVVGAPGVSL